VLLRADEDSRESLYWFAYTLLLGIGEDLGIDTTQMQQAIPAKFVSKSKVVKET
jgi:hypothetical protein